MRLAALPLIANRSCPEPVMVRFLVIAICPSVKVIVCGVSKSDEKTTVSSAAAAATASRRLQSVSQMPSLVSSVFVTTKVAAEIFTAARMQTRNANTAGCCGSLHSVRNAS